MSHVKKTDKQQELKVAKISENAKTIQNLPGDILNDLQECFNYYDKENTGIISDALFRNILQNFGFHKMTPRDIEDELKRTDPEFHKRNAVDFAFVKHVVSFHWFKGLKEAGRDAEALECFKLFDKRDAGVITAQHIKPVLGQFLQLQISEQDVNEFIAECDPNGTGHVTLPQFKQLYLNN